MCPRVVLVISVLETSMVKMSPPDGQNAGTLLVGVGEDGIGVNVEIAVGEVVGRGSLVPVPVLVTVAVIGSVPVIETKRSRMRACPEVVSSPRKMKFGVW